MTRRMDYTLAYDAPAEKIYQDFTSTQHFEPFDHDQSRADGSYTATVTHAPGHIRGEFFLTETDSGSQMRLASECKVHIPLVGGKLEELILNGLEGLFDEE